MIRVFGRAGSVLLLALAAMLAAAQQDIPDAPSATRPPEKQLPATPAPRSAPPEPAPIPAVPPSIGDVNERDQMFTLVKQVNFVVVPVTVKDDTGHLVEGLLRKDFSVYESGVEQQIKLFTSDPFPLSAAVVLDLGMSDLTMRKVNQTLPALAGAFSQFDEIAFYTFGTTVQKQLDFGAVTDRLSTTLRRMKHQGRTGGVPVTGGPLASGPTINGRPVDPGTPHVYTPRRESRVLNDAIFAAAMELSKREKTRRKIIFVISDGREDGSRASYSDVLKVLLSHGILVYAVAVDDAAIPVYRDLQKVRIPRMGYSNILPKYAAATGGEVFPEFSEQAIESAYQRLTLEARNQYTLGYTTRATPSSDYRSIEVKVHRGGVSVRAKDGYYPLPVTTTTSK